MKKIIGLVVGGLAVSGLLIAQNLNVQVGQVTYQVPAELAGRMNYHNGTTLQVLDRTFTLAEIDSMAVSANEPSNTVTLVYNTDGQAVTIANIQTASSNNLYANASNLALYQDTLSGVVVHFAMSGVTMIEAESVDAYQIAGDATNKHSIIDFYAPEGTTLMPNTDYLIAMYPCDLYGGYRLSIYANGQVAHYFGVHQVTEAGSFIRPLDLKEADLEFGDPDAPLVEEERPGLNEETKAALATYKRNPTEENKQALLEQMGIRYDKVVACKKAKLRELEREAHHQSLIDEMQAIVDEMVENRDIRIEQQFLRLIDPRDDDDPTDAWMVLRGSNGNNAYIGYTPVTNIEYKTYNPSFTYTAGQDSLPVVNISYTEAVAYCNWLASNDANHTYRLPSEEEWILAAGHMPKDIVMNSNYIESGLTSVTAYKQSQGACGGVDFWGNCWEWTSTQNADGEYIVKGGAWDSDRDSCRTEYSDDARIGTYGYANVGFRVVREDR